MAVWHKHDPLDLIGDEEKDILSLIDGSCLHKPSSYSQAAEADQCVGVQVQVMVMLLSPEATLLRQSYQRLEPFPFLFRHSLHKCGYRFLPFLSQSLPGLIEVEAAALGQEAFYPLYGWGGVLDPGGHIDFGRPIDSPAILPQPFSQPLEPLPPSFALLQLRYHLSGFAGEEDICQPHLQRILAKLPQAFIDLKHFVVKADHQFLEFGAGIADSKPLPA